MAKKKKKSSDEKKSFQYNVELNGLLFILIGLIGFGGFGPVGKLIKNFAIFLIGNWWPIVLLLLLILGCFMLIKRKLPKFFTARLIGVYVLLLVILVASHFPFLEEVGKNLSKIFEFTIDQYMNRISNDFSNVSVGGGIIGCAFGYILAYLFELRGTTIVLVVLTIFGIVMLFDITLTDIVNSIKNMFAKIKNKIREDNEEKENKRKNKESKEDEEDNDDGKIVITSVEELKQNIAHSNEMTVQGVKNSGEYNLPPLDLLDDPVKKIKNNDESTKNNINIMEKVFKEFGVKGKVVEIHIGPSVAQYEVKIEAGTKVNKIVSIKDELKLALAVKDIRIQAPIPGKSTIGIEVPNAHVTPVKIKEILTNVPKSMSNAKILASLGKDIMGNSRLADISKMPHLLVAGSTGSGKSVCINNFIATILMRYKPNEVKLVLIDPKKVELSNYNGVPHLLCPVVTNPKKASVALQKIVAEMERRYETFSEENVKNITSYNEKVDKLNKKNPELKKEHMSYYVVIIDELADLMLIAAKEVEDSIMRITQMARAAGIHLIVATQRPSTDVITGVVKANIPSRIAFAVSSAIDSRTILDQSGAERLLGKGDMLYLPMGENIPIRIQGAFISDEELQRVIDYVCKEQVAQYDNSITEANADDHNPVSNEKEEYDDPLYNEIVDFAVKTGKISASLLQRRFRVGYNRAARIVDLLEERGIIGPQNGSKPREVLVKLENKEEEK